jgi:hypothetical protein
VLHGAGVARSWLGRLSLVTGFLLGLLGAFVGMGDTAVVRHEGGYRRDLAKEPNHGDRVHPLADGAHVSLRVAKPVEGDNYLRMSSEGEA